MPNKLTADEFIKRAQDIHKNKYQYHLVDYKNNHTEVKIICPEHGVFEQRPDVHLRNNGCSKCGLIHRSDIRRKTLHNFIQESLKIHNAFYDYSQVNYKAANIKVDIICPEHGIFSQKPNDHLRGHGCPLCARRKQSEKRKKTTSEFISAAKLIHGLKYNYEDTQYYGAFKQLDIKCPIHGVFKQRPNDHLNGSGCPSCTKSGFNRNKPAILYYIKDTETGFYKIGITNLSVEERFGKQSRIKVIRTWWYPKGQEAYDREQKILDEYKQSRILNESWMEDRGGKTEFFDADILGLDCSK